MLRPSFPLSKPDDFCGWKKRETVRFLIASCAGVDLYSPLSVPPSPPLPRLPNTRRFYTGFPEDLPFRRHPRGAPQVFFVEDE